MIKLKPQHYAEIVLALAGVILIIDSLFLHLLTFAYPEQIVWLDEFINHWMLGVVFILIAYIGLRRNG